MQWRQGMCLRRGGISGTVNAVALVVLLARDVEAQCATPPPGAYFQVTAASPLYSCGVGETATGATGATCYTNDNGTCFTDGPGNCLFPIHTSCVC